MRIIVTGHSGQVATALLERAPTFAATALTVGRPELDLANTTDVETIFAPFQPDIIVSAAAYTQVDRAEAEPDLAYRINAGGAGAVARAAGRLGIPILHLSTDYVFDGSKRSPWTEDDPTIPLGVYGTTKLAGEGMVRAATARHVILRVAWIYSPYGTNFAKTMLKLSETRDELRVVADQIGAPASAIDIADGIFKVARNVLAAPQDGSLFGVFHMAPQGEASWADFAEAIFQEAAARGCKIPTIIRIPSSGYPTPARRPMNSVLDSGRLARVHGIQLPNWRGSLIPVLDRLIGPADAGMGGEERHQ